MTALPLAHETWLTDDTVGVDWDFVLEGLTLALLAAAVLVTLAVRLLARRWPGIDVPLLARMAPFMPFAVRLHLAVSLVGLVSLGYYLSPAMDLQADFAGIMLGAVMVIVAIAMVVGFQVRAAAWLLIAAGPLGMLEFGVSPVIQRIDMLGPAVFLLFAGAGRWSTEFELGRVRDPSPEAIEKAVWGLRVFAGVALIVVAFVEKLGQPDLALDFLAEHPQFNVADQVGLPMGDLEFARVAGAIEVLFGLLLISGALPQAIVVIAGIPFNATLWFFGNLELVGHLPIYGTMLVLLVYGSSPQLRPLVSRAWPWRAPPGRAPLADSRA